MSKTKKMKEESKKMAMSASSTDTYYRKNREKLAKKRLELFYKQKYEVEPEEIPACREHQKLKRKLERERQKWSVACEQLQNSINLCEQQMKMKIDFFPILFFSNDAVVSQWTEWLLSRKI